MNDILYGVECADMNRFGNGVFIPNDGAVVFVPGAVSGDVCDIKITAERDGFRMGEIVRIISPSAERADPVCSAFGLCGGCDYLHISRKLELEIKRRSVEGALKKQRLEYIKVKEAEASRLCGYRNKAVVHHDAKSGGFGFYSERTHSIVKHAKCLQYPDFFGDIFAFASASFKGDSRVRAWFLRCDAKQTNAVLCASVTQKNTLTSAFVQKLRERFPIVSGVGETVNNLHKPLSFSSDMRVVSGVLYVSDSLCGILYKISPASFYQVNHEIAGKLYSYVANELEGCGSILDLYSGIGTISMTLAKMNPRASVTGVEIVPQAVADAKAAALGNGIANVRFICADAEKYAADIHKRSGNADALRDNAASKPDAVVIDPPRAGCGKSLPEAIAKTGAEKIVYVSCNPDTLARDLRVFEMLGYRAAEATLFDMFPGTGHVETVCLLSKVK